MKILLAPINKFSTHSKLSKILDYLGWTIVNKDPGVKLWVTDGVQEDRSFINARGIPINKQRVNDSFNYSFGYKVGVSPEVHSGKCVEKRMDHGTHGRVIQCPYLARPGYAYQKLLWNREGEPFTDELRLDIFGDDMICTLKHQVKTDSKFPQAQRTDGSSYFDVPAHHLMNEDEIDCVFDFCSAIGLQYGSLDAIRHVNGKLYIIDATTNTSIPHMSWHVDLTLEKYIRTEAEMFEKAFGKK